MKRGDIVKTIRSVQLYPEKNSFEFILYPKDYIAIYIADHFFDEIHYSSILIDGIIGYVVNKNLKEV